MDRYLRVENQTRGTLLATRCRVASSFPARVFGLLGTASLPDGEALLLRGSTQIDMFFMRYPIDAAFLDGQGRVVRVLADLKPWRVGWGTVGARDTLELPAGTLARSGTQVGDQLRLEPLA